MRIFDPNLSVRFAKTEAEIIAAQNLRYRIFVEELGAKVSDEAHRLKREYDAFDQDILHLCLFDNRLTTNDDRQNVVGVYRLIDEVAARKIGGFYTEEEFDIGKVLALPGLKLELGRSCLLPQYRGGAGMAMLWSALCDYIEEHNITYLFGAASFHGTELLGKRQGLSLLHHQYLAPEAMRATAKTENALDMRIIPPEEIDRKYAMRDIPSLIKTYLRLGGTIGDGAYIDKNFNTIDVFVLMHTSSMIQKYKAMHRHDTVE